MNKFLKIGIGTFWVIAILLAYSNITAQTVGDTYLTISPENPKPFSQYTVTYADYSPKIDESEISWYINGKLIKKGLGDRTLSGKTEDIGTVTKISIVVNHPTLGTKEESLNIRPGEIIMIWEAKTYTPPFYKGKSLYSNGAELVITAIPNMTGKNGKKLKASDLIYKWTVNDKLLSGQSGFGKNVLAINSMSYFRGGNEIYLEARTPDDSASASAYSTISPVATNSVFYEDSPIYGKIYENSIGQNYNMLENEIEIAVEPYFFSISNPNDGQIKYDWKMNNNSIFEDNSESKSTITLRKPNDSKGQTILSVLLQHKEKLLQGSRNIANIIYSASSQSSNQSSVF